MTARFTLHIQIVLTGEPHEGLGHLTRLLVNVNPPYMVETPRRGSGLPRSPLRGVRPVPVGAWQPRKERQSTTYLRYVTIQMYPTLGSHPKQCLKRTPTEQNC